MMERVCESSRYVLSAQVKVNTLGQTPLKRSLPRP